MEGLDDKAALSETKYHDTIRHNENKVTIKHHFDNETAHGMHLEHI